MVKIKVTQGGESLTLEAPQEMMQATDEQLLGYVNETLKPDPLLTTNNFQVERVPDGLLIHPSPQFG